MSHCHSGLLLAGLGFSCVLGPKANSNPNPNSQGYVYHAQYAYMQMVQYQIRV